MIRSARTATPPEATRAFLAKRDLVADEFHARRDGDATLVEVVLRAMPAGMVHLVAGNLGQVVGVREVRVVQHAPEMLPLAA